MITRNLDVEDGCVHGTFGTIVNIVTSTQDGPKTVALSGLKKKIAKSYKAPQTS